MGKTIDALKKDFVSSKAGRANPNKYFKNCKRWKEITIAFNRKNENSTAHNWR